jgi:hypothetical protein
MLAHACGAVSSDHPHTLTDSVPQVQQSAQKRMLRQALRVLVASAPSSSALGTLTSRSRLHANTASSWLFHRSFAASTGATQTPTGARVGGAWGVTRAPTMSHVVPATSYRQTHLGRVDRRRVGLYSTPHWGWGRG